MYRKKEEIQLIKKNRKIITLILICTIIIASLAIISSTNYLNPYSEEISDDELSDAISNSINFLKVSNEPHALLWLDVMYRRFGIEEFSNAAQQYDQLLENNPRQVSQLRLFRRIIDYNNTISITDFNSIIFDLDQITVPALYCNRIKCTYFSEKYFEPEEFTLLILPTPSVTREDLDEIKTSGELSSQTATPTAYAVAAFKCPDPDCELMFFLPAKKALEKGLNLNLGQKSPDFES